MNQPKFELKVADLRRQKDSLIPFFLLTFLILGLMKSPLSKDSMNLDERKISHA